MYVCFAFVFATIAVVVSGSAIVPKSQCSRFYTVVSGDTCDGISAKTSTPTFQLQEINADVINGECTNLFLGEVLCLGLTGQDCTDVHVVQSGDSCVDIANDAGTTLSTLLANNPNVNSACTDIYVGEVLCTANHIIGYD